MSQSRPFRAIIVGGGPVGLFAGHVFHAVGLDYVILERHDPSEEVRAATIGIWPHNLRVLEQLEILDALKAVVLPGKKTVAVDGTNGKLIMEGNMFATIEKNHGYPWMLFRRRDLLRTLYQTFPNKSRLKAHKAISDIISHEDGVSVICEDGTMEEGTIVIGADGVHSKVRSIMGELAAEAKQASTDDQIDFKNPYSTEYWGMYGYGPLLEGAKAEAGIFYEARGYGMSHQMHVADDIMIWLLYRSKERPTPAGEPHAYTVDDKLAMAKSCENIFVGPNRKFKQIWESHEWSAMVDLEEGIFDRWYWERIMLVGDACTKMTPNLGMSLNTGMQNVVALANKLCQQLVSTPNPSTAELEAIFAEIQDSRMGKAEETLKQSALTTRLQSYTKWTYKILDQWVIPLLGGAKILAKHTVSPLIRDGLILDFLKTKETRKGAIPWVNGTSY